MFLSKMVDLNNFFGKADVWEIKGLIETHKKLISDKTYFAMLKTRGYCEGRIEKLEELYNLLLRGR